MYGGLWPSFLHGTRILPTRNGNRLGGLESANSIVAHGSYLQGMETWRYRWKQRIQKATRILPTRNGNITFAMTCPFGKIHGSYLQGMETISDLKGWMDAFEAHGSYLQGMETFQPYLPTVAIFPYTDPTYKEWKQLTLRWLQHPHLQHGSYLQGMETSRGQSLRQNYNHTDPTYKEWKQQFHDIVVLYWDTTRILPTRNGNSAKTLLNSQGSTPQTRILPTRNGNYSMSSMSPSVFLATHGSYLQGMETALTQHHYLR